MGWRWGEKGGSRRGDKVELAMQCSMFAWRTGTFQSLLLGSRADHAAIWISRGASALPHRRRGVSLPPAAGPRRRVTPEPLAKFQIPEGSRPPEFPRLPCGTPMYLFCTLESRSYRSGILPFNRRGVGIGHTHSNPLSRALRVSYHFQMLRRLGSSLTFSTMAHTLTRASSYTPLCAASRIPLKAATSRHHFSNTRTDTQQPTFLPTFHPPTCRSSLSPFSFLGTRVPPHTHTHTHPPPQPPCPRKP